MKLSSMLIFFNKEKYKQYLDTYNPSDKQLLGSIYKLGLSDIIFQNHMKTSKITTTCILVLQLVELIVTIILEGLNLISDNIMIINLFIQFGFLFLVLLTMKIHECSWKETKANISFLNEEILDKISKQ